MSPFVWDLAHIGNYEELWLLREIDGRAAIDADLDDLYNAFEHPRWERPSLPILGPTEARAYLERVRDDVLDLLDRVDLEPADRPRTPTGCSTAGSSTAWCCSTSTSTTRPSSPPTSSAASPRCSPRPVPESATTDRADLSPRTTVLRTLR